MDAVVVVDNWKMQSNEGGDGSAAAAAAADDNGKLKYSSVSSVSGLKESLAFEYMQREEDENESVFSIRNGKRRKRKKRWR